MRYISSYYCLLRMLSYASVIELMKISAPDSQKVPSSNPGRNNIFRNKILIVFYAKSIVTIDLICN